VKVKVKIPYLVTMILLVIVVTACSLPVTLVVNAAPTATKSVDLLATLQVLQTQISQPTATLKPTSTPEATSTPEPTLTSTVTSTSTTTPTATLPAYLQYSPYYYGQNYYGQGNYYYGPNGQGMYVQPVPYGPGWYGGAPGGQRPPRRYWPSSTPTPVQG
jgi:hypothetical protein